MGLKINIDKLLKKFLPKFLKSIQIDYSIGSAVCITNAKKQGKETSMNPLSMTKKDQKVNIEIIESLIKDVNSEVSKKINYIVNKGITEKWDNKIVADEISKLDIQETYKNRYKTIAQNESFRIMSTSSDNTARRLGAKKKYLYNLIDNRTAEDSKISQSKYGTEEQAIDINKPFKYKYKGVERVFMIPPDRVNDRSFVLYSWD